MEIDIDNLTLSQVKKLKEILSTNGESNVGKGVNVKINAGGGTLRRANESHPMVGKRCLIRTYSAGVHIGDVCYGNGMEIMLLNSIRLWSWSGGGLSLSAVANNGINGGRLNRTGEVYLTNVIEIIPTTAAAEKTYKKFIEDETL